MCRLSGWLLCRRRSYLVRCLDYCWRVCLQPVVIQPWQADSKMIKIITMILKELMTIELLAPRQPLAGDHVIIYVRLRWRKPQHWHPSEMRSAMKSVTAPHNVHYSSYKRQLVDSKNYVQLECSRIVCSCMLLALKKKKKNSRRWTLHAICQPAAVSVGPVWPCFSICCFYENSHCHISKTETLLSAGEARNIFFFTINECLRVPLNRE